MLCIHCLPERQPVIARITCVRLRTSTKMQILVYEIHTAPKYTHTQNALLYLKIANSRLMHSLSLILTSNFRNRTHFFFIFVTKLKSAHPMCLCSSQMNGTLPICRIVYVSFISFDIVYKTASVWGKWASRSASRTQKSHFQRMDQYYCFCLWRVVKQEEYLYFVVCVSIGIV